MKYAPHPRQIIRYRAPTRINHWIVAICVLTALSGWPCSTLPCFR